MILKALKIAFRAVRNGADSKNMDTKKGISLELEKVDGEIQDVEDDIEARNTGKTLRNYKTPEAGPSLETLNKEKKYLKKREKLLIDLLDLIGSVALLCYIFNFF